MIAAIASSSLSKGLAFKIPLCISFGTAECLTTAPSGAIFPFKIAIAPFLPIGSLIGLITSLLVSPTFLRYLSQFS